MACQRVIQNGKNDMKKPETNSYNLEMRKRAEALLNKAPDEIREVPVEDIQHLVHELRVHQIELEMQNEELRRTQMELEAARNKYSDLYDFAPVGYFMIGEKGMIEEVNLTGASMLGVERRLLIGMPFSRFIFKEDQDIFYLHRQKLLGTETLQSCELRLLKKDGHEFWAGLNCMVVEEKGGDCRHIRAAVSDISEQKQAEDALRESEERYRGLIENIVIGVYRVTEEGKFIMANQRMAEIFGYVSSQEFLEGVANISELYARPEERPKILEEIREKGFIKGKEVEFIRKDGGRIWIELVTRVTTDRDGTVVFEGLLEDITELKILEAQLRQAQKMEAIGTLTGGIAHEFNNILAAILGNCELAIDDIPEWNPAHGFLKGILTAGLRAKDVVRQLLSFSRKAEVNQKPIDIIPVIRESLKFLRSSIPTFIEFKEYFPSEPLKILADATQIHQVMLNLCTNAAHAMADGGILEMSLDAVELTDDDVSFDPDLTAGNYIKLTVSDTGHGIDTKDIERIFDPYFTTKEVDRGTGMGLAVIQGLVKGHHGAITVESEVGKGTTFTIYLPITGSEEVQEDEAIGDLPMGNERILFVDDEMSLVKMGRQRLEGLGYKVDDRTDPVEALELFRASPDRFDLVITDMTMPGMTGDKLAQEILKIRPDIPTILCTGYSDKIDSESASELGISEFIAKPVDRRDLATIVRKVLGEPKR